ncbi:MAG TPA: DUF177 domain-containing protein [Thermoanaerobaculia bacterium]|nr:DUF177 domain-containing protein [Thermoanaerobaculia bacterium]
MDLNLETAFDEPVDLSHEFEIPSGRLERPELLSLSPVSFTGRLEKVDLGFVLAGRLSFSGVVACARCLAPVPFARKEEASWTFMPAHVKPVEKPRAARPADGKPAKAAKAGKGAEKNEDDDGDELSAEDLDVLYYEDFVVPFDPLVEEQLQLELPMKALCRDDCKGLCPQCGSDRNAAPCDCAPPSDERWKSLKTILETDEKN